MIEDKFKTYLKEKETVRLSADFDKDIILIINKHAINKSKDKKYLRLMYLFFASGLLLGFMIAITFVDLEFIFRGNKFIIYRMILIIPLIVILLFLFEKIYKATMVRIGKEKFSSI
jgi:hypothetical protein